MESGLPPIAVKPMPFPAFRDIKRSDPAWKASIKHASNATADLLTYDDFCTTVGVVPGHPSVRTLLLNMRHNVPIYMSDDMVRLLGYKGDDIAAQRSSMTKLIKGEFAHEIGIRIQRFTNARYAEWLADANSVGPGGPTELGGESKQATVPLWGGTVPVRRRLRKIGTSTRITPDMFPQPNFGNGKAKTIHTLIMPKIFKQMLMRSNGGAQAREYYVEMEESVTLYREYVLAKHRALKSAERKRQAKMALALVAEKDTEINRLSKLMEEAKLAADEDRRVAAEREQRAEEHRREAAEREQRAEADRRRSEEFKRQAAKKFGELSGAIKDYTTKLDETTTALDRTNAALDRNDATLAETNELLAAADEDNANLTDEVRAARAEIDAMMAVTTSIAAKLNIATNQRVVPDPVRSRNEVLVLMRKPTTDEYKAIRCQLTTEARMARRVVGQGYTAQVYRALDPNSVNVWNRVKAGLPVAIGQHRRGTHVLVAPNQDALLEFIRSVEIEKKTVVLT